jgi:hypothetical protein
MVRKTKHLPSNQTINNAAYPDFEDQLGFLVTKILGGDSKPFN